MSIVLNEIIHEGAYIVSESPGFQSRDTIVISNAAQIVSGTVLGMPGNPAGETEAVAAAGDNTGNGVLTLAAPATTAQAVDGPYTVEFTAPTTFNVRAPNGRILDKGVVGTAFANAIAFTIAAGATAFAAGDRFTVTVLRPDVTGDAPAPLAGDGSVEAAGILFSNIWPATPAGTCKAVMHARNCEVRASDLTWPTGFTAPQIAEATLQLKRRGIILR